MQKTGINITYRLKSVFLVKLKFQFKDSITVSEPLLNAIYRTDKFN